MPLFPFSSFILTFIRSSAVLLILVIIFEGGIFDDPTTTTATPLQSSYLYHVAFLYIFFFVHILSSPGLYFVFGSPPFL